MSVIAGLQDSRKEGPPADIGSYQMPCSVMVFKYAFSGVTYVCAVRSGDRRWILVSYGLDAAAATVVQAACTATNAIGGGEVFARTGLYTMSGLTPVVGNIKTTVLVPANVYIIGESRTGTIFKLADNNAANIFASWSVNHVGYMNMTLDGNRAGNADGGVDGNQGCIYDGDDNYTVIDNIRALSAVRTGIFVASGTWKTLRNLWAQDCGDIGVALDAPIRSSMENIYAYANNKIHNNSGIFLNSLTACAARNLWGIGNYVGVKVGGGNNSYTTQIGLDVESIHTVGNTTNGIEIGGVPNQEVIGSHFGLLSSELDGRNGIYIVGLKDSIIDIIRIKNCGQAAHDDAVATYSMYNCKIGYLYCLDDQGTHTTNWAWDDLHAATVSGNVIEDGQLGEGTFLSGKFASYDPTKVKALRIAGFVTENKGTSTGTGAQQDIAHGLAVIPTYNQVFFSERSTGGAIPYQSAAPDATNIHPTATLNKTYNWYATAN